VHAVREDGLRRGLLFAATDTGVHVSFDDGDRWQSLALNLPPAPVRSLAIKHDDLVVAVDGAGFWVLDDIMALRQLTPDVARAPLYLFRPAIGWRSALPGHGVVLSYLLGPAFSGTVTLEVRDAITETVLRRFSSGDADATIPETPGLHRVVWDARLAPPRGAPRGTPGAMVLPGTYQVRLTSGERVQRQAVVVRPDPRARASVADLTLQFRLSTSLHDAMRNLDDARHVLTERHAMLAGAGGRVPAAAAALDRAGRPLLGLFLEIQQADARPTDAQQTAIDEALQGAESALAMFRELVTP
jgi:hypothetical protein